MSVRPRYPFVWLGVPLALIILFSFGPLVALLLGGAVAGVLGCNMPIAAIIVTLVWMLRRRRAA